MSTNAAASPTSSSTMPLAALPTTAPLNTARLVTAKPVVASAGPTRSKANACEAAIRVASSDPSRIAPMMITSNDSESPDAAATHASAAATAALPRTLAANRVRRSIRSARSPAGIPSRRSIRNRTAYTRPTANGSPVSMSATHEMSTMPMLQPADAAPAANT